MLNQSRQTMVQPVAAHYCIYITGDFAVKNLMKRVKRVLPEVDTAYALSIEKSLKLHIHLVLILDMAGHGDRDSLFIEKVIPAISNLKNVMNGGCVLNPRINKDSYYHDLLDSAEFEDAIERYSYFAKTSQKQYVPQKYKKAFNTSQIKHNKYYNLGDNKMIKPTHSNTISNHRLLVVNDYSDLTDLQLKVMNKKIKSNNFKLCFAINDQIMHKPKWFYVLSCDHYTFGTKHALYIGLDELWSANQPYDSEWYAELSARLKGLIEKAVKKIKQELSDDQELFIYTLVPKRQELEEVLSLAVSPLKQIEFNGLNKLDVEYHDDLIY